MLQPDYDQSIVAPHGWFRFALQQASTPRATLFRLHGASPQRGRPLHLGCWPKVPYIFEDLPQPLEQ